MEQLKTNAITHGNVIKHAKELLLAQKKQARLYRETETQRLQNIVINLVGLAMPCYSEDNILGVFVFWKPGFFSIWMIKMWRRCHSIAEYIWVAIVYICHKIPQGACLVLPRISIHWQWALLRNLVKYKKNVFGDQILGNSVIFLLSNFALYGESFDILISVYIKNYFSKSIIGVISNSF